MKQIITADSNCIDIGCHKGEILAHIIELAPQGKHFAFEPIPALYKNLKSTYSSVNVLPYALSDENKTSSFQYVKNAPAYSGIKKRKYAIEDPDIEEIDVELKKLDEVIPEDVPVSFIKIDVEGAEYSVLKGAKNLLIKNKPVVIFEFGLGASDYYNTHPSDIYNLLVTEIGLKISTLQNFLKNKKNLSSQEFEACFNSNCEYYFIAHP
ncbi:MAG: FkbM family methyltransferase [Vicingus serpentipes]|nr:FkbM family methyltransferase [Vicingus serpentipes]